MHLLALLYIPKRQQFCSSHVKSLQLLWIVIFLTPGNRISIQIEGTRFLEREVKFFFSETIKINFVPFDTLRIFYKNTQ